MDINLSYMPSRAKQILANCKTADEVEWECVLWTLELLDEYKFKPVPMAPAALSYTGDDEATAFKRSTDTARVDPEIMRYYELKRKVQAENSGNYDWLKHCQKLLLRAGKPIEAQAIKVKLEEVQEEQLLILKEVL